MVIQNHPRRDDRELDCLVCFHCHKVPMQPCLLFYWNKRMQAWCEACCIKEGLLW